MTGFAEVSLCVMTTAEVKDGSRAFDLSNWMNRVAVCCDGKVRIGGGSEREKNESISLVWIH